jgi:hypothetical protein
VRSYQDTPVPEEVVRRVVEAASDRKLDQRATPALRVVQDKELRQLGKLAKTGPYTAEAASAVVVAVEKDS